MLFRSKVALIENCIVVLKGHQTVVTDGKEVYINCTGNPGMATAGSGDVLAGMIGAFLVRGFKNIEAAKLGVYLHGLSGDMAKKVKGEESLIARDLLPVITSSIIFLNAGLSKFIPEYPSSTYSSISSISSFLSMKSLI